MHGSCVTGSNFFTRLGFSPGADSGRRVSTLLFGSDRGHVSRGITVCGPRRNSGEPYTRTKILPAERKSKANRKFGIAGCVQASEGSSHSREKHAAKRHALRPSRLLGASQASAQVLEKLSVTQGRVVVHASGFRGTGERALPQVGLDRGVDTLRGLEGMSPTSVC